MIGQYLITFREVLEAALITAIILAYLTRTGREHLSRYVWYGVYLSVGASIVLGIVIWTVYGTLSKPSKVLFEGVAALIAVGVLTTMIYWMAVKGKHIKKEIENRVGVALNRGVMIAMISLAFLVVFREGLETVLFLTPFLVTDAAATLAGAVLGVISGFVLAFAIFKIGMKIDLQRFFYFTSILLILLAAGLLGYAVHELTEYTVVTGGDPGWLGQSAYVLDISKDSVFHHKGAVGSVFAVMFGYTVSAEWIRVIAHVLYLVIVMPLVIMVYRRPDLIEKLSQTLRRLFRIFSRQKNVDDSDTKRSVQQKRRSKQSV
ncbi:MAG: ferrous iron transporter [Methanomassiliicoccales archaeon]|nr:MAG: ferrous iron transporter [Methanomassiliicoccales archaeon]